MPLLNLEEEVEALGSEVTRLRLMVQRCVESNDAQRFAAAEGMSPAPYPQGNMAISGPRLPMPGDPMAVLPTIFSGAGGTARLLSVILETYPWLLPPDLREARELLASNRLKGVRTHRKPASSSSSSSSSSSLSSSSEESVVVKKKAKRSAKGSKKAKRKDKDKPNEDTRARPVSSAASTTSSPPYVIDTTSAAPWLPSKETPFESPLSSPMALTAPSPKVVADLLSQSQSSSRTPPLPSHSHKETSLAKVLAETPDEEEGTESTGVSPQHRGPPLFGAVSASRTLSAGSQKRCSGRYGSAAVNIDSASADPEVMADEYDF